MIKRLLILNGLAIIGAVIHHSIVFCLTAMFWWTDQYLPVSVPNYDQVNNIQYHALHLLDLLVFGSVFAFLFVSGYFLAVCAGHQQRSLAWKMVLKRIYVLAIPYLIWSFVIVALKYFEGTTYSLGQLILALIKGSLVAPYYYVIVLIQLYLLAPLWVPLAQKKWKLLLSVVVIIQIFVLLSYYAFLFKVNTGPFEPVLQVFGDWHLLSYSLWGVLGAIIGFYPSEFKRFLNKYKTHLLIALGLSFAASLIEWEFLSRQTGRAWFSLQSLFTGKIFAMVILFAFFAFEKFKIPFTTQLTKLAPKSYGIYLIHAIILEYLARLTYHFAPKLLQYQLVFLALLVVAGVGIPVLMMWTINKIPKVRFLYSYLFG